MTEVEKTGWKLVYVGSGTHLERVLRMYKELSFETRLEPVPLEEAEECLTCYEAGGVAYRVYIKEVHN